MFHDAESGATTRVLSFPRPFLTAFRRRRSLRSVFLAVFAASTVFAVACGGGESDASNPAASPGQDTTADAVVVAALSPIGVAGDFEVITPNHGVFNLEQLEGRPVLLNFWFPSCPPCRVELPDLQAAYEKHGDDIQFLGVQLVGLDSAEDAAEFLDELGITYPSGPDEGSRMVRKFKIVGFPTTVFIDSEHNIVKKHTGILNPDKLDTLIKGTVAVDGPTVSSGS